MGWVGGVVVAHKTLVSAQVPIGIGIRGLGLGIDNFCLYKHTQEIDFVTFTESFKKLHAIVPVNHVCTSRVPITAIIRSILFGSGPNHIPILK